MSQRSIRRAQLRRQAAERRREMLKRRRTGLAVTAAIGATALFGPAAANAATFEVNTTNDAPAVTPCDSTTPDGCTLRQALNDANNDGEADTITFASALSGSTITLTEGELNVSASDGGVTIQGPGAGNLTISGNDNDRIFDVYGSGDPVKMSGLTLTHGYTDGSNGAAVNSGDRTDLTIADSILTGNDAGSAYGGAIYSSGPLTVTGSTIQNNTARSGGGIESAGKYAQMHVSNSTISSNSAQRGGGIDVAQSYKYSYSSDPVKHAVKSEISDTTISGNSADAGAGVNFSVLGDGDHFTITHSTVSGNDAASSEATGVGGGIHFADSFFLPTFNGEGYSYRNVTPIEGEFRAIDSTISGNTADVGGGVSLGGEERYVASLKRLQPYRQDPYGAVVGPDGSVDFENSTIASNSASSNGGGVYLNSYDKTPYDEQDVLSSPTIGLTSTILADNTAGGGANDADRADGAQSGGLDASDSLVENQGDAPFSQQASTLTGVDPQLGGLADNGGPTKTQLPSTTSPVIDKGDAPARLTTDQRGQARTVQGDAADVAGGDGTDIGAAEVQNPAKNPPPIVAPAQQVLGDRTPPKINLKVPRQLSIRQLIRGFRVTVSCSEPCSMTFRLFGSAPTGTLHSAGYNFRLLNRKIGRKAGTRKVLLRPCVTGAKSRGRTHVCRKRITAALFAKPQRTFKVKLIVAAKDQAGNVSHTKKFIRVHH